MTQEKYRVAVLSCRHRVGKVKADLELNLARDVNGNKRWFCKYINRKRKIREKMGTSFSCGVMFSSTFCPVLMKLVYYVLWLTQ